MGIRERKIENYIRSELKKNLKDVLMEKWGKHGNPDDIVFYRGRAYFIEVKTKDGSEQSNQVRQIERIRDTGVPIYTLYGYEDADWFIEMLKKKKC